MRKWSFLTLGCLLGVLNPLTREPVEATSLGGPSHIGTFEGGTTFTTSSSNGINPGLYLEVMDEYGNYHEYTSEDGVITIPDTQEGAYVTQAKLLGKTKYRDQDTGELLDQWEDGRNLTLESVQMPVLTTQGKNFFYGDLNKILKKVEGGWTTSNSWGATSDYLTIQLEPNTKWTFSFFGENTGTASAVINGVRYQQGYHTYFNFTTDDTGIINLKIGAEGYSNIGQALITGVQIEKGEVVPTSYEPYKSNILSTSEDVVLRGIGEVKDELNLLTGEVTGRIGEIVLDGSDDEKWTYNRDYNVFVFEGLKYTNNYLSTHILNKITWNGTERFALIPSNYGITSNSEGREYLSNHPITLQYKLESESVKTVVLNSTYHFKPVDTREILVEGSILPLICSVTTPTTPLSFVLNPNAEEGQRFIAPEFTIRNQTPSAVSVELKQFTQTSNVLNDVLPTKYENWNHLNKNESKDIALALVPLASDGWESLLEGPRYVKDNSNYRLGTIKAESSVDFTFEALHGRAFTEALDPQYRLVLVFDF